MTLSSLPICCPKANGAVIHVHSVEANETLSSKANLTQILLVALLQAQRSQQQRSAHTGFMDDFLSSGIHLPTSSLLKPGRWPSAPGEQRGVLLLLLSNVRLLTGSIGGVKRTRQQVIKQWPKAGCAHQKREKDARWWRYAAWSILHYSSTKDVTCRSIRVSLRTSMDRIMKRCVA